MGVAALALAWANEEVIERVFGQPLEKIAAGPLPGWLEWLRPLAKNRWWLTHVSLATGITACWFAQVNVIEWPDTPDAVGKVITGVLVGSGSQLLHGLMERLRGK